MEKDGRWVKQKKIRGGEGILKRIIENFVMEPTGILFIQFTRIVFEKKGKDDPLKIKKPFL